MISNNRSQIKPFYLNVRRVGNTIKERYIDSNGMEQVRVERYQPTLFTKKTNPTEQEIAKAKKTLFGETVYPVKFNSMSDANQFIENAKLAGTEVCGMDSYEYAYISDKYQHVDPKGGGIDYTKYIRMCIVDIEVTAPEMPQPTNPIYPIDLIVHKDKLDNKVYIFDLTTHSDGSTRTWDKSKSEAIDINNELSDQVVYMPFETEHDLLASYLKLWRLKPPVAISGWRNEKFDMPYIVNRVKLLFGENAPKMMSPFKSYSSKMINTMFGQEEIVDIHGVATLDYYDLYKKMAFTTPPNFKLQTISELELGRGKLDYDGEISKLRDSDHQKYVDYCIIDVDNVDQIDKRRGFFNLSIFMMFYNLMNMQDILGTLKPWDCKLFNALRNKSSVIPMIRNHPKMAYEGAYVKPVLRGRYRWVVSFDLTSLYTSIIRQLGISPETFYGTFTAAPFNEYIAKRAPKPSEVYSCSPTGQMYRKDVIGVIPTELEKVFFERISEKQISLAAKRNAEFLTMLLNKKLYDQNAPKKAEEPCEIDYGKDFPEDIKKLVSRCSKETIEYILKKCKVVSSVAGTAEKALKLQLNSLYGALGNVWFRYYSLHNATAITGFGRLAIQWIIKRVNEFLNNTIGTSGRDYVIAADTDSIYINVEPLIERMGGEDRFDDTTQIVDFLDAFAKNKAEPMINDAYNELAEYMNTHDNLMHMDREAIAGAGKNSKGLGCLWVAKKAYAINVFDMEGTRYATPQLKIMGLATQKSSTPIVGRRLLKECLDSMLQGGEEALQENYERVKSEFISASYLEMAGKSKVSTVSKNLTADLMPGKGCPYAVKGVLAYMRATKDIRSAIPIVDEDEVNYIALKPGNPFDSPVMAWPAGEDLPFSIRQQVLEHIDLETQFEKAFLKSLTGFTEAAGINYKKVANVNSFFM